MNQKVLNKKATLLVAMFLIIYCGLFVYSNLKAKELYDQAVNLDKPIARSGLKNYYRNSLSLLSAAIKVNKANADYLTAKADQMLMAIDDGLKVELSISDSEIEDLYSRAVKINPVNFEYHLKLGWFYVGRDDKKGEAELIKAVELYPKEFNTYLYLIKYYFQKGSEVELIKAVELYPEKPEPYLYLAKYYFSQRAEKKAFQNLLSFLHYEIREPSRHEAMKELMAEIENSSQFIYDWDAKKIGFTAYPQSDDFDLKREGYPHLKIGNLRFIVHAKGGAGKITLYEGDAPYANFEKRELNPEFSIYRFHFRKFEADGYLDDFKIKIDPTILIDKMEIVQYF